MVYMNRKEGTGVRARSDLTANALPSPVMPAGAVTNDDLLKTIKALTAGGNAGLPITLKPEQSLRLADVLLEAYHRSPDAQ